MFWQEEIVEENFSVPDTVQDCVFGIDASPLPVDHLNLVANALLKHLPWLNEVNASIHDLSISSGNGWEKPQNPDDLFYLSKRSKLTIRLTKERLKDADILLGKVLKCGDYEIKIRKRYPNKKLSDSSIIFAKYIPSKTHELEEEFLNYIYQSLQKMNITPKKMMAGLKHTLTTNNGIITTRSLMLADLSKKDSYQLQAYGLGDYHLLGCGLFMPQKGINLVAPV